MSRGEWFFVALAAGYALLYLLRWSLLRPRSPRSRAEALYNAISEHCPRCGGPPHFAEGPRAGACQNIFCTNCGQGYNVASGVEWAKEIHRDKSYIVRPEKPRW
jgi:ribosomal protein S27AE